MNPQDWLYPLICYVLLVGFLYLGTALTIRLMGRRMEASLSMAAAPAVRSKFQPYMEGLRGLLAINIFLIHCAQQYAFHKTRHFFALHPFQNQMGACAVTYFFFMTGYLLWKGLLDNPNFSGIRFLRGRFYRTFPAYAMAIVLVFFIAFAKAGFRLQVPLWKFIVQFVLWLAFGLPAAVTINGFGIMIALGAGVLWTLQVDWFYYLLFPLFVWFSRKDWRLLLLIALGVAVYVPLLHVPIRHDHFGDNVGRVRTFVEFFCTSLSLGMVLAVFKSHYEEWPWARTRAASFVAVGWLLFVWCFVIPHWGIRESLLLLPTFVLLAYGNDFFGLFTSKAGLLLGRISYSIYLLHSIILILCLHFARRFVDIGSLSEPAFWVLMAPFGMIALWVSMLSHRFVEMPFTTIGRRRAASAAIPAPQDATRAQIGQAIRDEAAELPGSAEAEIQFDPTVRK